MKPEYDLSNGVRGPILLPRPGTTQVRIGLDDEVLDWCRDQVHRAGGGDYPRLIIAALQEHIERCR